MNWGVCWGFIKEKKGVWYIFWIFWTFSTLVISTFYSLSTMFYVTSLMLFLDLYGQFYYLILFRLSYHSNKILHSFLHVPLGSIPSEQDKLLVLGRTTTGRLSTARNWRIMGIYKSFDFLILKVLKSLGLGPCCLIQPPNPKPCLCQGHSSPCAPRPI